MRNLDFKRINLKFILPNLHKSIQVLIEWIWPVKLRDIIKFSWSLRLKDVQSLRSVKKEWGIFTIWSSYETLMESSYWKNQLKSLRFIYSVTWFKYLGQLQKAFKSRTKSNKLRRCQLHLKPILEIPQPSVPLTKLRPEKWKINK